jgi:hypothetical protein
MARVRARLVFFCALSFVLVSLATAQIPNVTEDTATPIEGAGHDYIKGFSETVNPASGSLSIRIQLPTAKGRGLTLPISIGFDSNGFRHLKPGYYPHYGTAFWTNNTGATGQGGWIYSVPQLNADDWTQNVAVLTGYNNGPVYTVYHCQYDGSYVFRDGAGSLHSLGLGSQWAYSSDDAQHCPGGGRSTGGDPQVRAALPDPAPNGPSGQPAPYPIVVYEPDGTVYNFPSIGTGDSEDTPEYALPNYIEDRNGKRLQSRELLLPIPWAAPCCHTADSARPVRQILLPSRG